MTAATARNEMVCPKCGGPMWDETKSKFYKPGGAIAKCKNKDCGGKLFANPAVSLAAAAPSATPVLHGGTRDEQFEELFSTYNRCYAHALKVARQSRENHDLGFTAEGVASIAATLLIASQKKGLI